MTSNAFKEEKPTKQPRVLVVDDVKVTRRALELILDSEFDVTTLASGNKAVDHIRQDNDFDVVSLDLNMPGMSGIETLKVIKQHSPTIEVLLVTAFQDIESAKQALKLGAYDYIEKPINKDAYRQSIRQGVRRRQKALVSEKAQQQLEIVKAQLVHSEKLSAIGELLAGVVHEINNPLAGILGYSELLLLKEPSPEKAHKYVKNIQQSAILCQRIVQKLLAFSRKQKPKREYVQVTDILESTLELVQHEIKKNAVQVVKQFADNLPRTIADFYQIQQVFLNIISNAVQAMQQQTRLGTLTVISEFDEKSIRITIRDSGPGIPRENLRKIFEPFFTTKPEGKGTGLGLSICYEIIREHGGDFYVSSEPGRGTYFFVELPVIARDKTSPALAPSAKMDRLPVAKNILVIDERETGYDLLENMITALEHHVAVAHDVYSAQQKLQNKDYDVIISNMNMPEFSGQQLYEHLNQVKPELLSKLLFITGGVISEEVRCFIEQSGIPCISKPFGLDEIQEAIQKIDKI
ncbi:MAG: response regulator [Candidatus Desulfatibia sp.]|uniref:response regulator n=1 Tax=Candidatus Desulfatibia sp. TaxID=3101189 RepID=UPI002F2CE025